MIKNKYTPIVYSIFLFIIYILNKIIYDKLIKIINNNYLFYFLYFINILLRLIN